MEGKGASETSTELVLAATTILGIGKPVWAFQPYVREVLPGVGFCLHKPRSAGVCLNPLPHVALIASVLTGGPQSPDPAN